MLTAHLTLPPGRADAVGLPSIVIPHGGLADRDEWGFNWLAQYFAQRGYAVMQPDYRGLAGYGEQWFRDGGFQSRSEEHTSELQSLMRISYAVFCLKKKK